jgi:ATP-dependent RNA helicase RhlE
MSFASLGLSDALVRAVTEVGYTQPTPIQMQAIPAVLAGHDLLAGAQTGTGKTAGFVLPILQRLAATPRPASGRIPIRTLILTPTRELAAQVEESVRVYGKHTPLTSTVVYGGVSINPQIAHLKRGVDILVATPGRLLDHHGQRTVDLSHVEVLVLDEADRMLDMGFIPDIKRILKVLPARRQNLLFSATFSDEIRALATGLLKDPVGIQVTPRNTTVESVAQKVLPVDARRKADLLLHLIREHNWFQVLVFTRTKHGANKLATFLEKNGVTALAIHGNKSQNARTRALAEFKSAKLQVLVATDIAARGIDIDELPHVVNYDLPNVPEDYVHRIGRTGRAGSTGEALSLVAPDEMGLLRDIERVIRRQIPRQVIDGFDRPLPGAPAMAEAPERRSGPARRDGGGAGRGGRGASPGGRKPGGPGAARSGAARRPDAARDGEERRTGPRPARQPNPQGASAPREPAPARTRSEAPREPGRDGARAPQAAAPRAAAGARHGAPRRDGREPDTGTRANLPPGWPGSTPARRR